MYALGEDDLNTGPLQCSAEVFSLLLSNEVRASVGNVDVVHICTRTTTTRNEVVVTNNMPQTTTSMTL